MARSTDDEGDDAGSNGERPADGAADEEPDDGAGSGSTQIDSETATETTTDTESDGQEWRFSVDEVGPDAGDDVPEPEPIEPGTIRPEHALFVVLGVFLTIGILVVGL